MARYTERRRHRRRPDRRARPRSEGIRRPHSRPRRPPRARSSWRRRPTIRRSSACMARWLATSIAEYFRERGLSVLLHHGFADAVCAGAARDRPRHRRSAGHARLSAVGVRAAAGAGRARRQRLDRARLDHRFLHRAHRRRRPAGSDRRRGARHPRWPRRVVATHRRSRAVPGHRHRSVGQPRDARNRHPRARRAGAALPPERWLSTSSIATSSPSAPTRRAAIRASTPPSSCGRRCRNFSCSRSKSASGSSDAVQALAQLFATAPPPRKAGT